ncbi:MAG: sulfatase-like hydrolase/transferase, partial [Verrucomicrobiota bacterium]
MIGLFPAGAEERPNVLVFLVDDMGVMDTSLPGADQGFFETPNLERLAEQGMTFANGYCAHPRCVESRFAIQTGRSPYRDGAQAKAPEKTMRLGRAAKTEDIRAACAAAAALPEVDAGRLNGLGICASAGYMVDASAGNPLVAKVGLV